MLAKHGKGAHKSSSSDEANKPLSSTLSLGHHHHSSQHDRPRPILDGLKKAAAGLEEANQRRIHRKQEEQQAHDDLVAKAAKADLLEKQRRQRETSDFINELTRPWVEEQKARERQQEIAAAIERDRRMQIDKQEADRLYQEKIERELQQRAERQRVELERQREEQAHQHEVKKHTWQSSRDSVYKECESLLKSKPQVSLMQDYVRKIQAYRNRYAQNREFFDWLGYDAGMEKQLDTMLVECNVDIVRHQDEIWKAQIKQNDNATQQEIHMLLAKARGFLDVDDLSAAADIISKAYALVKKISNVDNIEPKSNYIPPDVLSKSLHVLNGAIAGLDQRASQYAPEITKRILEQAFYGIDNQNQELCLYTKDLERLKDELTKCLKKYWYKFDSREFPQSLSIHLIDLIKTNVEPIGWKRWWRESSKSKSLKFSENEYGKFFPLTDHLIPAKVAAYKPVIPSPVFIELEIFSDRTRSNSLPFNPEIVQAAVLVSDSQEVVPQAELASVATVVTPPSAPALEMKW